MPNQFNAKALVAQAACAAAALLLATSAQATLLGRDLSGNAVATNSASAVFFYDTDRNITWLRNANAAAGSAFDNGASNSDGRMGWNNAMAWAADLTVGSFSDWRLSPGVFNCSYNCGELGHLWYDELGNALNASLQVIGTVNTGDFQNLLLDRFGYLWTSTETDATHAFAYGFGIGSQGNGIKESSGGVIVEFQALAVRDGDVLRTVTPPNDVPEPGALLLTAAALVGLGVARRKGSVGASRA